MQRRGTTADYLLTPSPWLSDAHSAVEWIGTDRNTIRSDRNIVCWTTLARDRDAVEVEVIAWIGQISWDDVLVVSDTQQTYGPANTARRALRHKPAQTDILAGLDSFQSIELHMYRFVVKPDLLRIVIVITERVSDIKQQRVFSTAARMLSIRTRRQQAPAFEAKSGETILNAKRSNVSRHPARSQWSFIQLVPRCALLRFDRRIRIGIADRRDEHIDRVKRQ